MRNRGLKLTLERSDIPITLQNKNYTDEMSMMLNLRGPTQILRSTNRNDQSWVTNRSFHNFEHMKSAWTGHAGRSKILDTNLPAVATFGKGRPI